MTKAAAIKISEVFGGWHSGFAVDVIYEGGESKRVHLDRSELIKDDGSYDQDYVCRAVEVVAPSEP